MATRRSRESILVGILKACASDKLTVTRLMLALNLQHKILKNYLEHLASAKLVERQKRSGRTVISTTDKGVEAIKSYRIAIGLLNGYSQGHFPNERLGERENSKSFLVPA